MVIFLKLFFQLSLATKFAQKLVLFQHFSIIKKTFLAFFTDDFFFCTMLTYINVTINATPS